MQVWTLTELFRVVLLFPTVSCPALLCCFVPLFGVLLFHIVLWRLVAEHGMDSTGGD